MKVNFFKDIFNITHPQIEAYAEEHTSDEDALLYSINRRTHLESLNPRMLSGKLQGQFLSFISQIKQPKNILEIGTYTGYSAICLAKGLQSPGRLDTIEVNAEMEEKILFNLNQHPRKDDMHLHIGDALDVLPTLEQKYDLVFIDAQKSEYLSYFEAIKTKMTKGGIMIFDNVLWGGKVLEEIETTDQKTATLKKLNKTIQEDPDVDNILIPFRDGLMITYFK